MRRIILIVTIFSCFIVVSTSLIPSVESSIVKEDIKDFFDDLDDFIFFILSGVLTIFYNIIERILAIVLFYILIIDDFLNNLDDRFFNIILSYIVSYSILVFSLTYEVNDLLYNAYYSYLSSINETDIGILMKLILYFITLPILIFNYALPIFLGYILSIWLVLLIFDKDLPAYKNNLLFYSKSFD